VKMDKVVVKLKRLLKRKNSGVGLQLILT